MNKWQKGWATLEEFDGTAKKVVTDTPQGNICSVCWGMGVMAFKESFSYLAYGEERRVSYVPMAFPCTHCNGTGVEPVSAKSPCMACHGFGWLQSGQHKELWGVCDGSGIEPESVDCDVCGAKGVIPMRMYPDSQVTCARCKGLEPGPDLVDCPKCEGEGRLPGTDTDWITCPHCSGKRRVWGVIIEEERSPTCPFPDKDCTPCSKREDCYTREYIVANDPLMRDSHRSVHDDTDDPDEPTLVDCDRCSGTGLFVRDIKCRHCGGTGKLEVVTEEPTECEPPEVEAEDTILQKLQKAMAGVYEVRIEWVGGYGTTGVISSLRADSFQMQERTLARSLEGIVSVERVREAVTVEESEVATPPDMTLQAEMVHGVIDGKYDLAPHVRGIIRGATGCSYAEAFHFVAIRWGFGTTFDDIFSALQTLWLKVHSQPEESKKDHIPGEADTFQDDPRTRAKVGV